MSGFKVPLATALLAALPIEALNFFFLAPPIDVGYQPGTPWYIQLIGAQWVILHFLGLCSFVWFERVVGCHANNVVMGCRKTDISVLFVGGYLETALLLLALIVGFKRVFRLSGRAATDAP